MLQWQKKPPNLDMLMLVSANRFNLNISKTKCLLLGSRQDLGTDHELCISLQGAATEQVKLLGVTLEGTLSWSTHVNNIVAKMSRGISSIRRCTYF